MQGQWSYCNSCDATTFFSVDSLVEESCSECGVVYEIDIETNDQLSSFTIVQEVVLVRFDDHAVKITA